MGHKEFNLGIFGLIALLLISGTSAQSDTYVYNSDQQVFWYEVVEDTFPEDDIDAMGKKDDIFRFELSSSIRGFTREAFQGKSDLFSVYLNEVQIISEDNDMYYFFKNFVYFPVKGNNKDLFEEPIDENIILDYGEYEIKDDEIKFHQERDWEYLSDTGESTLDITYNKDSGILISAIIDYDGQEYDFEYYLRSIVYGTSEGALDFYYFLPFSMIAITILTKARKLWVHL